MSNPVNNAVIEGGRVKPYYAEAGIELFCGDSLAVLPTFAAERFSTVITDPPYHLTANKRGGTGAASLNADSPAGRSRIGTGGFMGKHWDGGDVAFRPETWVEALRVCKPGATLLAFGGTRTFHRLATAIEDAGWEIRDCMMWLYGSGFPKSLDISKAIDKAAGAERERYECGAFGGKFSDDNGTTYGTAICNTPITAAAREWSGWGTALKPAWEPIIVAMKPLDSTFAENAIKHGVAGLNIDGGRIGESGARNNGRQRGTNGIYGEIGATTRVDYGKGRWPANVVLDEPAAAQLDATTGDVSGGDERLKCEGSRPGGFGDVGSQTGNGKPCGPLYADHGGASRFFYTAKASRSDRGHGNDHPTVKPLSLMRYLCTLTATPDGGEILDLFGGSMTTAVAAQQVGRKCVAIDLDENHCRIGVSRLAQGHLQFGESA